MRRSIDEAGRRARTLDAAHRKARVSGSVFTPLATSALPFLDDVVSKLQAAELGVCEDALPLQPPHNDARRDPESSCHC